MDLQFNMFIIKKIILPLTYFLVCSFKCLWLP